MTQVFAKHFYMVTLTIAGNLVIAKTNWLFSRFHPNTSRYSIALMDIDYNIIIT